MDFKKQLLSQIAALAETDYPWLSAGKLEQVTRLLDQSDSSSLRNRKSGVHLSASAFVLSKGQAVFIRHPYLHTILLPAGHVEPTELPIDCAVREFHEETGFYAISKPLLIDVNVINIPANPVKGEADHQHIDLRFTFQSNFNADDVAELPVFMLTKKEAPLEFQPYFTMYYN